MQEKEMISDYLAGINASLAGYGGIIPAQQATPEEVATVKQQVSQG